MADNAPKPQTNNIHFLRLKLSENRLTINNPTAAPAIPIDCNKFLNYILSQYNLNSETAESISLPLTFEPASHPPYQY